MKDKRQPIPNQSTRAGGTGERRIQSFLDAALHVAGTHVPVPTLSPPPGDLAARAQLSGSQGEEDPRPGPHFRPLSLELVSFLTPSRKKCYFKENSRAAKSWYLLLKGPQEAPDEDRANCPVSWALPLTSLVTWDQKKGYGYSQMVSYTPPTISSRASRGLDAPPPQDLSSPSAEDSCSHPPQWCPWGTLCQL